MRNRLFALCLAMLCTTLLGAETLQHIEPPCWWVGMNTELQLMLHGRGLRDAKVTTDASVKGLTVTKVTSADNDDFLFVDVRVSDRLKPGSYHFNVLTADGRQYDFDYAFLARRKGSAKRDSFGPSDAVYLLMPDRFANGSKTNDSSSETAEKSNPKNLGGRHGGDIQGIIDHLDDIYKLGATTIWSTPLLLDNEKSYSYHGYACADYYHIDPRFGDNAHYRQFVDEAHGKGLKVIMDIVTNHCGTAHWWMDNPPFPDWYQIGRAHV